MSYYDREWYRESMQKRARKRAFQNAMLKIRNVMLKILKWGIICYLAACLICAYRVQNAFSIVGGPFYQLSFYNIANSWLLGYVPAPKHMVHDLFSTDEELIESANRTLTDMFIS